MISQATLTSNALWRLLFLASCRCTDLSKSTRRISSLPNPFAVLRASGLGTLLRILARLCNFLKTFPGFWSLCVGFKEWLRVGLSYRFGLRILRWSCVTVMMDDSPFCERGTVREWGSRNVLKCQLSFFGGVRVCRADSFSFFCSPLVLLFVARDS